MRVRLATWNLENFDERPGGVEVAQRIAALRPKLSALRADVLCLQEVGAERVDRQGPRTLSLLSELLEGTAYAGFTRVAAGLPTGGLSNIHNLVVLSRFPVVRQQDIAHRYVEPPVVRLSVDGRKAREVRWDRPLVHVTLAVPGPRPLHVIALHLRAPLATALEGQKVTPSSWKSVPGWAEGFWLSSMKRTGQALEARLLVEALLSEDADALVLVAGDFNAELSEMPLRLLRAEVDDTGNPALSSHSLTALEATVPDERRFTVVHEGRRQVLDHLLASGALARAHVRTDILNDGLGDEWTASKAGLKPLGSFHAPVVSEVEL
ncbi:MAG: endonuclease/exonuclease/phosphatase family protein [Myxococcota bacterium]